MSLSVAQAAAKLGVSERRVRALISAGNLHAERVGSQWVIDDAALARHEARAGRSLSPRSAWGLIELAEGGVPALPPSEVSRARKRLRSLVVNPAPERVLRSWFAKRAERRVFRASPRDIADLRAESKLQLSGVSHSRSGISAADVAEGYVQSTDLSGLVREYLLVEAANGRGNVILHVVHERVGVDSNLLLAADLAEHHSPRENGRAAELVGYLAESLPPAQLRRRHPRIGHQGDEAGHEPARSR